MVEPHTRHEDRILPHLPEILDEEVLFLDICLPDGLTVLSIRLLLFEFLAVPRECPVICAIIPAHNRIIIQRITVLIEE